MKLIAIGAMAREGIPTPPCLGTPEQAFDLRPERLPGCPLGLTPFDLESLRSQGSSCPGGPVRLVFVSVGMGVAARL
jgi:hypothetical protein